MLRDALEKCNEKIRNRLRTLEIAPRQHRNGKFCLNRADTMNHCLWMLNQVLEKEDDESKMTSTLYFVHGAMFASGFVTLDWLNDTLK